MKKLFLLLNACGFLYLAQAQPNPEKPAEDAKTPYRESSARINDLVHTKLDVRFDYAKSYLYGKAWITLQPHFYVTDSLALDAKGMDIHKVEMVSGKTNKALKYKYDGWILNIKLDKSYSG